MCIRECFFCVYDVRSGARIWHRDAVARDDTTISVISCRVLVVHRVEGRGSLKGVCVWREVGGNIEK